MWDTHQDQEVGKAFRIYIIKVESRVRIPLTRGQLWLVFWCGWRYGGAYEKRRTPSHLWDFLLIILFICFLLFIKVYLL